VQITMAEDFGVQGRGAFYDETGAIRDVIQNHLFQVLANLAMEPPPRTDSESIRDEKVKVLKAIPPLESTNLVRGQFSGYRKEKGVAPDSAVETFAALQPVSWETVGNETLQKSRPNSAGSSRRRWNSRNPGESADRKDERSSESVEGRWNRLCYY
jgi:hypothetical protein